MPLQNPVDWTGYPDAKCNNARRKSAWLAGQGAIKLRLARTAFTAPALMMPASATSHRPLLSANSATLQDGEQCQASGRPCIIRAGQETSGHVPSRQLLPISACLFCDGSAEELETSAGENCRGGGLASVFKCECCPARVAAYLSPWRTPSAFSPAAKASIASCS